MTIQKDKVVTMHYHLTNTTDGQVLDSSQDSDPLTYLHGSGTIIPGLEQALTGLDVGETKKVEVTAVEGYGEFDEEMVQTLPREPRFFDFGARFGNTVTVHLPSSAPIDSAIDSESGRLELPENIFTVSHPRRAEK